MGKIWIGTDAGLDVFPKNKEAEKSICERLKSAQIWGVSQLKNQLFVASYDSGLFKFDLETGALLQHWDFSQMPRIRRIRKIKESLYIIHGEGITQITPHRVIPLLRKSLLDVLPTDFPTEVFTINGQLHVAFFGKSIPYRQLKSQEWIPHPLFNTKLDDTLNRMTINSAKEIDGHTYLGLFPNRYVDYSQTGYKVYTFKSAQRKKLTIRDIDGYGNNVYLALGNNTDSRNGYFWKHDPNGPTRIELRLLDERKYAWGVTADRFHNGVWFSTLTDGAYFKPHYNLWISVPDGYHDFRITSNYIIAWNSFNAFIRRKDSPNWSRVSISGSFKDVLEYHDTLYFLNNTGVSYFNAKAKQINPIGSGYYESFCIHQDQIYLFRLFGLTDLYDLKTHSFKFNHNQKIERIIRFAQNEDFLLVQSENKGYFLLENNELLALRTDLRSDISKNKFFFCGNFLITQIGYDIRISTLNKFSKKIKTIKTIDLKKLFPNLPIEWINAYQGSLWMGNSSNAFQFSINEKTFELDFHGQFYLGASPLGFEPIQLTQDYLYKKGKGEIMVFPTDKRNAIDFQTYSDLSLSGATFNFKTIIPRTWVGQTFTLLIKSDNYFYNQYGRQPIEIWGSSNFIERKFIRIDEPYVFDNFPHGVYKIQVGPEKGRQNLLFRIQKGVFYNLGFWVVLILTLFLLGYVSFQYQREKLSMNQKIISLQLSTLKSNLNPHFIFNIMNLIQALIVKSEKTKALKATSKLATLNRMFLETSNKDLISLAEELDFADKYMNLERMRFEDDATITFEIVHEPHINPREWYLPPLILQPLLENALKYGRFEDYNEPNTIKVSISTVDNYKLYINIANPVAKKATKSSSTNLGISLVKDRIALLNERYPSDYRAHFRTFLNEDLTFVAQITIEKLNIAWMFDK